MEQPNLQLELRLQGIGISIVNNLKSVELVYMVSFAMDIFRDLNAKKIQFSFFDNF